MINDQNQNNSSVGVIAGCLSLVLLILIFAFPMNYIWNIIFSRLFGFPISSYWEIVGIGFFVYMISRIARA